MASFVFVFGRFTVFCSGKSPLKQQQLLLIGFLLSDICNQHMAKTIKAIQGGTTSTCPQVDLLSACLPACLFVCLPVCLVTYTVEPLGGASHLISYGQTPIGWKPRGPLPLCAHPIVQVKEPKSPLNLRLWTQMTTESMILQDYLEHISGTTSTVGNKSPSFCW